MDMRLWIAIGLAISANAIPIAVAVFMGLGQ